MNDETILREIRERRAYRALSPRPVPREVLERLLHAATLAPSCMNKQPWRFLVALSEEARGKVAAHLSPGNYWAKEAPAYVLVVTAPELDCQLDDRREYAFFDTGMAVMGLLLQATHEGLYAHPMAGFDAPGLRKAFGISERAVLLTVIALGYPGDPASLNEKHREVEKGPRVRKPLADVVCWDEWDEERALK
ncbi:nitroreductase [Spirochaeta thermophila DSM 6578]|uniref:Nitroreductase n=1 Tax=Winmispira thermophila (strain ATCC 700085 / DSM 6578 / Z-1203) TaxID=869211 RepID=G0GEF6_WINT7|nr:nitroreductase family protein [Spirochaeta thermophila]AEJ62293.1 nitroreductase [Spirochaeta thermophila DSM 6578]